MNTIPRFAALPGPRLAGLLVALSAVAGAQTTWYVDVHGAPPGVGTPAQPFSSIQYAISRPTTVNGDTLIVAPGEYVENVNTGNKRLTIRSSGGPRATTIRPAQLDNIVILWQDTDFEGFTLSGNTPNGFFGSIYVRNGEAHIRRCIVRDNATGCGILSAYDAYVDNCTVTGNLVGIHATNFGGMAYVQSSIVNDNGTNLVADPGGYLGAGHGVYGVPDPGFWDLGERDLSLRPGSVAIDAGDPGAPHDPDGSVTDAGALTYDPTYAPGPISYCTGKVNSQSCTPAIGAVGSASASLPAAFVVTAVHAIPSKPGLLLLGFAKDAQPFQGAWLCIAPPLKRLGAQISSGSAPCAGSYDFDMRAHIQSGVQPGLLPGVRVYCQWWNRDPLDPAGFGSGLSDALYFGIAP